MKYFRSLFLVTVGALGALTAIPAYAIGTQAGTTVTNAVTLNYQVNGFAQTPQNASVQFVVDRAIATSVAIQDSTAVVVTPGQTSGAAPPYPALNFDVTNTGNDLQDLWLALIEQGAVAVTGLAGQGGGAAFAATAPVVAVDMNTNGVYDFGTDTVLPLTAGHYVLTNMVRDTTRRVLVVVNVPTAALDGARDTFTLAAGVAGAGGGGFIGFDTNGHNALGFAGATNVVDDIAVVQNLFADTSTSNAEDLTWNFSGNVSGVQDIIVNGQHSDSSAFVVNAAEFYIDKSVQVLWDPITGNRYSADNSDTVVANPKAIPGAVLMYAVGVQNDTGSPSTTVVVVSDDLQTGPIAVGNTGGAPVFVPDNVTFTFNAVPVALNVPNSPNLNSISTRPCVGAITSTAFAGSNPEVTASVGTCAATQTGVIVYFVTLL